MSEQNRPQHPRKPQQQSNQQQGYPQQEPYNSPQQGQQPYYPQNPQQQNYQQRQPIPQGRPMPPQAPPPVYQQPLPAQQPAPQPEKIYVEKKSNPLMMVLKVLAFPFVKIFQIIGNTLAIIFQEMVRSIVNFVFGIILLVIFVALVGGYIFALIETDFDFVQALPEMLNVFQSILGMGGG